jgi:hypothetical protein
MFTVFTTFTIITILLITFILGYRRTYEHFGETHQPSHPELAKFINFNLTEKPVANYAPFYIYQWWKNGPDLGKYATCNQYRCKSKLHNECNAKPYSKITNSQEQPLRVKNLNALRQCEYYKNSEQYCSMHPEDTRCPDYWRYKTREGLLRKV